MGHRFSTASVLAVAWVVATSCGSEGSGEADATTGGSTSSDAGTGGGTTGMVGTSGADGGSTSVASDDDGEDGDDGIACLSFDIACTNECLDDAECAGGQKCVPLGDAGGAQCVPIVPDATPLGEPCTPAFVSDECEAGAVCWTIDGVDDHAVCTPVCFASTCADATLSCSSLGYKTGVCLAPCDPTQSECAGVDRCAFGEYAWWCWPDHAPRSGAVGASCMGDVQCEVGLACVATSDPAQLPSCVVDPTGSCCATYCDVEAPACAMDQACTAWSSLDLGPVAAEYAHVGVCTL